MIISKTVKLKLTGSLVKKYNGKQYDIIDVNIADLSHGSHSMVDVECDFCFSISSIEYRIYLKQLKHVNKFSCRNGECLGKKQKEICFIKHGVDSTLRLMSTRDKIKKTNLEKYGVENPFQSEEIKERIKETNLEKYGVENAGWTEESQKKIKETNLEKYGVENPFQSEEIKERIKETNVEKYGVEHPMHLESIKNKLKDTFNLRYGVNHQMEIAKVREKIKETNIEKYGVECVLNNDVVKQKIKSTNLERYGVENYSQSNDYAHKYKSSLKVKNFNGINYQSKYELDFLQFCHKNNIDISKDIPVIDYKLNDSTHKYYPDFYLKNYNLVIEVKSTYWYNKHLEMNEEKEKQTKLNGFNYIIIMDKDYEEFMLLYFH